MADWTGIDQKLQSVNQAAEIVNAVRSGYASLKRVQELLAKYQANADTTYVATTNAVYTSAQRGELANVAGDFTALITELEANHRSLLGLP